MASKRRIRWDRISVAAIVLVLLIFLLGSCVSRCTANKTGTAETSKEGSEATAEQTTAPPAETQPPETKDPAAQTMANVPVMITDAEPSHDLGSTTTAAEESSEEPAYVLPAGYQEIPVQANAVYSGTLVLVNAANPSHLGADELELEQVYYADDRQDTYEISYPGHTSLNKGALAKFNRLMKAYYSATANKEIMFNYGYLETNQEKSNPESSTGLDVQLHLKHDDGAYEYVQNVAPYSWLFDHMASYGFILRYPPDKSDLTGERGGYTAIRYVGVPHAAYMAEKGLCLEEYLDMLKKEHDFFSGTILEYSTSELTYHIYYVPVGVRDNLSVPVPKGGSYEISGNNIDGFIVTAIVG
ncbi:MAG TPA: hypothetical protein DCP68_05060 [Ruminococcus sp.]|nr:hypothetical protein [Ruminococcus sp.]